LRERQRPTIVFVTLSIWGCRLKRSAEVQMTGRPPETPAPTPDSTQPQPNITLVLKAYKQMLISSFVATIIVACVLLGSITLFYRGSTAVEPSIFLCVLLAGALGAFFSSLTRLYGLEELPKALISAELRGLTSLSLFVYSLVPATVGIIAAGVIHITFASGILQGAVFPNFICKMADKKCETFGSLITEWGPKEATDYAKILFWEFVAGFVERFVPDTLERLAKSGQEVGGPH
jgi:hypothetical protein